MFAHRSGLQRIVRRTVYPLLLLAFLGAWSPRPIVLAEQTQIPAAEYDALVALYNSTDGANWTNKWTLPTDDPCGLYGVTCTEGHVTRLVLRYNGLNGVLPSTIENLGELVDLYLDNNQISGVIPPQLGTLSELRFVVLDSNSLDGAIPSELGNLTSLSVLSLRDNNLGGMIPEELGDLTALTSLNLGLNQLWGVIPEQLGALSNLGVLSLDSNLLTGEIPSQLGSLQSLFLLDLGNNGLTGTLPAELWSLTSLQSLRLDHNQFSSALPPTFGDLTALRDVDLSYSALRGPLPASITNLALLGVPSPYFGNPTVDFGGNSLWTFDATVAAFLDSKDPDWASSQRVDALFVGPEDAGDLGLLATDGSAITVTVPAGAVPYPTALALAPLAEPADAPDGLLFAGRSFALDAYRDSVLLEGFAFDTPVTMTLTYTDDQVAGVDEGTLALYVREGTAWVDAATTCAPPSSYLREPDANRLTVPICHLSEYALFGEASYKAFLPLVMR